MERLLGGSMSEIDIQLINCAGNKDLKGVTEALKKGASVKIKEPKIGATALIAGSISGSIEIMKLLLDSGSDVNAMDNNRLTPLFYCAAKGNTEGVKLLLSKGADIKARNAHLETALMRPAAFGYTEVVKILLDKDADPNAQGTEGSSVLMLAADNGHTEIVKLLLEKGAKKDLMHPYSYKIAYDYARRNGHRDVEQLLKPKEDAAPKEMIKPTKKLAGKELEAANKKLKDAIRNKEMNAVISAIESGADVNAKIGGDYPIILATGQGGTNIVELLIRQGANVNVEDSSGLRAITKACGGGFTDILKLLLDNGAEIKNVYIVANDGIAKLLEEAQKR